MQQTFPVGRFHATPWRAFPFDDPYGEWPPSPWRLLRAILARSFQLSREFPKDSEEEHERLRELLVHAFCTSKISWQLPTQSWRGPGIQQYHPADFEYSHPSPRKFKVYDYREEFRDGTLDIADLGHELIKFFTIYKDKSKKDILEFFNENMELVKMEPDIAPEKVKALNDLIRKMKLTARKYKHYFPDEKSYTATKVKDNFWLTPENTSPLFWILDSDHSLWKPDLLIHLDDCLARMTYFGRAESITYIERIHENLDIVANCFLRDSRTTVAVPVLCPKANATLEDVGCMTNEKKVANSTIPPGAVWKYAERPLITKNKKPQRPSKKLLPTTVLQFAIGGRVFPPLKLWLRVTERFRGTILQKIAQNQTGNQKAQFYELSSDIRENYSLLTGKGENGVRLTGHRHAAFFLIPDEEVKPTRLICYRKKPFTSEEQMAILSASEVPLAWDYRGNQWKLRLVPLSKETPLPYEKDIFGESRLWETLVPYVPPLHVFRQNGKPKPGAEVENQVKSNLENLNLPQAEISLLDESSNSVQWMKVHRPRRERRWQTNDDKRGYRIRLNFIVPTKGPVFIGNSSHFGLGLFAPVPVDGSTQLKGNV
ncbi:type I-G CRISPR-associated protein Csb2 [Desulfotignum balticum]|jgi:CRISPR-associated protein Csb2|uniref:type I-G CRISPR-associated protein Csb2 n=1 Tax=Desulfotignum balticum TaxID=115781 RepID=UPI0012EB0801|nr:type I-U CRISPR-associated protein Csb2 [Desulfotignum balticum]